MMTTAKEDDALRPRHLAVSFVFGLTLFTSAGLLFVVQPIIGKALLPNLGGAPAVWNTCLVFFQAMLLLGYWSVHRSETWPAVVRILALALLAGAAVAALPMLSLVLSREPAGYSAALPRIWPWLQYPPTSVSPIPWLMAMLTIAIGMPFLFLTMLAPTLQRLFTATGHPQARDPYFLYGASNMGSMFALIAFPILIEPNLDNEEQHWLWIRGFGLLLALVVLCFGLRGATAVDQGPTSQQEDATERTTPRLRWLALGFVPASLLYGVTTYLSTDVAAVPLLWIIPLALYLLSFIVVFGRVRWVSQGTIVALTPMLILMQTFLYRIQSMDPFWILMAGHLATFFVVALMCHGELASLRPAAAQLTEFYLYLSLGGVLGGVFNTFLAPNLFVTTIEYPLALVLACLLLPAAEPRPGVNQADFLLPLLLFLALPFLPVLLHGADALTRVTFQFGLPAAICYIFASRPLRFALGVGAIFLAGSMQPPDAAAGRTAELVYTERNFFGRVRVVDYTGEEEPHTIREFIHGSTVHGAQYVSDEAAIRRQPLTYYCHSGPIGRFFAAWGTARKPREVAVVGLGAGTLAGYAEDGQRWTFFELDPAVASVADTYFDYLRDARGRGAQIEVILGDGRLELRRRPEIQVDLLFADAFSSDAVPVHLLTREALDLYLDHLRPGGVIVFNATNRFLDLEPVLAALAHDHNLIGRVREETAEEIGKQEWGETKAPSKWVVMARETADLGPLIREREWRMLKRRDEIHAWTDHYSDLWSAFRWR